MSLPQVEMQQFFKLKQKLNKSTLSAAFRMCVILADRQYKLQKEQENLQTVTLHSEDIELVTWIRTLFVQVNKDEAFKKVISDAVLDASRKYYKS